MPNRDRNKIVWTPDERILPMRSVQSGSRIGGAIMVLFSLAWCGVLYTSIIMGTIKEGPNIPMTVFMLFFSLPGLLFLYLGLSSLFGRTEITLSADSVEVLRKRVWRAHRVVEPLSAYNGVLRRYIHHQSEDGPSSTEYLILLAHGDPTKEVLLFESQSSEGWESAWHSFAQLLGLPLLDESELGIYQVGEEAPERKPFAPTGTEMVRVDLRGVEVQPVDGGYRFRIGHASTAWRGALGMVVAGLIGAIAWMMQSQYPDDTLLKVFIWVMAGFVLIAFGSLLSSLRSFEELTVTRDRVEYRKWSGRNGRRKGVMIGMQTSDVRSVTVKSDPMHRGALPAVTMEGQADSIRLAVWRGFIWKVELMRGIAAALGEVSGKGAGAFLPDMVMPGQRQIQKRAARILIGAIVAFFTLLIPLMWLAFHDRPKPEPVKREWQETMDQWSALAEAGYGDYRAGRNAAAAEKLERALALAENLGSRSRALPITLYRLSQVVERKGDLHRAADLAERSVDTFHAWGEQSESLGRQTLRLADLLERTGDAKAAAKRRKDAMELFREAGVAPPAENAAPQTADSRDRAVEEARRKIEEARRRAEESRRQAGGVTGTAGEGSPPDWTDSPKKSESAKGATMIRLDLKTLHPQLNRIATYSAAAPLPLSDTPSTGLHALPEAYGEVWYGRLTLGEEQEYFPFALSTGVSARLWLDRNRNGDLSDDGPPAESRGAGPFAAEVQISIPPIEKPLSLWLYTNDQLWKERRLAFYNRTQLMGRPLISGREFLAVIAERGRHDGNFSNDGIYVDLNRNGKIEPSSEYIPPGASVSLLGGQYIFEIR